jgi:hypothetical protein
VGLVVDDRLGVAPAAIVLARMPAEWFLVPGEDPVVARRVGGAHRLVVPRAPDVVRHPQDLLAARVEPRLEALDDGLHARIVGAALRQRLAQQSGGVLPQVRRVDRCHGGGVDRAQGEAQPRGGARLGAAEQGADARLVVGGLDREAGRGGERDDDAGAPAAAEEPLELADFPHPRPDVPTA